MIFSTFRRNRVEVGHLDRALVLATEHLISYRTEDRLSDQVLVDDRVKDLLPRTVPIGWTTVKTTDKIALTIEPISEATGGTRFPIAVKARSTTAKIVATIFRTIAQIGSIIWMSGAATASTGARKFASRCDALRLATIFGAAIAMLSVGPAPIAGPHGDRSRPGSRGAGRSRSNIATATTCTSKAIRSITAKRLSEPPKSTASKRLRLPAARMK